LYPVLSEAYAVKIARDRNLPASCAGYVTRFRVRRDFIDRYKVQEAGRRAHREYWIPAEDLDTLNAAIVGEIVNRQRNGVHPHFRCGVMHEGSRMRI
jgi:hypothetical protein